MNKLKKNDLNEKYDYFHGNIMQVVNKNIPLKKLPNKENKRKKKPWITKGIITSIHKRTSYPNKLKKQIINFSLSDTSIIEIG